MPEAVPPSGPSPPPEDRAGHPALDRALLAEALLSSSLDGVIVIDRKGRIIEFNSAAEQIFGWRREDIVGLLLEDTIIPHHHRSAHRNGLATHAAGGAARMLGRRVETEGLRRNGETFPVELTIAEANAGPDRLYVAFLRDITAAKSASASLQQVRATLQSIFDSVPAEMYLRSIDGTYLLINRWGANQLGLKPEDIVGRSIDEFRLPDEREAAKRAEAELLATGRPVTREYRIPYGDRIAHSLITIFPVRDSAGEITQIGGIVFDTTELHTARQLLQQARENLHQSEKLAALGQLLAGVSHELNNPLAVVLGRASILQEKLQDSTHAAPLKKLREAAERCARIVRTFLAMARQTGPRRLSVDANELVDDALEMTIDGLHKAEVDVERRLEHGLPAIEADPDQIVQVIINLLMNAQQALMLKDGARHLKVVTETCKDGRAISITVADNGPGIDAALAPRIFEPFFTTKATGEGTGLGLSVSRSLVEAHGGSLALSETPGGGATFSIVLPVGTPEPSAEGVPYSQLNGGRAVGRVLIIDDEIEIAAILADCLTPLGIECVIAGDGRSGLAYVTLSRFDAVFCDVGMPGMDGTALFEALRQTSPELAQFCVFVSGDVMHRDWDRLQTMSGRAIIEKPFDPEEVRTVAMRLLSDRRGHT